MGRKLFTVFLVLSMVMVMMPVTAFASENVAKIDDVEYATLKEAVEEAENGDTIELLADAEASNITIRKSLTFNLNGNTLKGNEESIYLFSPWGEDITVTFNDGIMEVVNQEPGSMGVQVVGSTCVFNNVELKIPVPDGDSDYSYGIKALVDTYDKVKLTFNDSRITEIEDPDVAVTFGAVGIIVAGKYDNKEINVNLDNYEKSAVLEINGSTINTTGFAVSGNGAAHGTQIMINDSNLTAKESTAIYHPQMGDMTVTGGSLTGGTGMEVRAGNVTVTGGTTITATADPTTVDPNGNGTTSLGAAIAVSQHTTKLPIVLNVENGALTGSSALIANNPQGNSEEDIEKISINISNGLFTGIVQTNGGGKVEVTGGTFDNLGDKVTIAADDVAKVTEKGNAYTIVGLVNINEGIKDLGSGSEVDVIKAGEGSAINAPDGVTVKNSSANTISVNDTTLNAGEEITVIVPEEDTPVDPGDDTQEPPTADNEEGSDTAKGEEIPKTGDESNLLIWLIIMATAATGAAALKVKKHQ